MESTKKLTNCFYSQIKQFSKILFNFFKNQIETGLRSSPFVENICICTNLFSDDITALISPNRQTISKLADQLSKGNLTFDQLCDDPDIIQHVLKSLRQIGHQLGFSKMEIPVSITLVKEEWNQDNNMITAAMKLRRKQVNMFYAKKIEQMFERLVIK